MRARSRGAWLGAISWAPWAGGLAGAITDPSGDGPRWLGHVSEHAQHQVH